MTQEAVERLGLQVVQEALEVRQGRVSVELALREEVEELLGEPVEDP
ncbi:MAG: hypothetical protein MZV63_16855 [Marinilabiliales bacterium]|nr:hypothetical protein [Marinilabiliales bacterium]